MATARGLLRSGSAATLAHAVRTLALLLTHIVVRRFVPPAEMGVWNWIEPVFLVLATLRDLGVPSHLVRLSPRPHGTHLRVQLGWGSLLALGVVTAAPWIAQAFHTPSATVVAALRVMALYLVLEGAAAVALTWFESELRIEQSLRAELTRTGVYCAVLLAASSQELGVWSFVAAQIAAQSVYAAMLWLRARRCGLALVHQPASTPRIVRESLPIGAVWMLAIGVSFADIFVVGKLFDSANVGFYALGYFFAYLVTRILQQPIGRSLYPALVAFGSDPHEQFRAFRLATVLFLALEVPAALLLAANAELVILVVGGRDYLAAAPYLSLLAFAPIVDPLGRFGGELMMARRLDRARLIALGLQLSVLVGGGILLCRWLGSPFGMAWANFLPTGTLVVLFVLMRGADRGEMKRLVGELLEIYLVPLLPFAFAWWSTAGHPWLRLAATLVAALASLAWVGYRHGGEFRSFFAGGVSR
jgi:O-antigen/teichoic acid export membrane protein